MNWKKFGRALLLPHIAVVITLLPVSAAFLIYAMIAAGTESAIAIASYVVAAYTLTICCFRMPQLARGFLSFQEKNKYARRWREDTAWRMKISLYGTFAWNIAYAALQLGLGIWHRTLWFGSLAGYYASLSVMRFLLLRGAAKRGNDKDVLHEYRAYRAYGVIFLVMNLMVSLMIFFMVYWSRSFHHHEITTIAIAAYTFTSLTLTIINTVKYQKYNSPLYAASWFISLASACVSMLILASTMLTTFGDATMELTERRWILAASGAGTSAFIVTIAIYMIWKGSKMMKLLNAGEEV
ncbi:MAG: hypothetical protein J6L87_05070 [Clostridia bacterium]|nr:hypothetical protein [Clostridia bacterium]